jgi:hypothetical protein
MKASESFGGDLNPHGEGSGVQGDFTLGGRPARRLETFARYGRRIARNSGPISRILERLDIVSGAVKRRLPACKDNKTNNLDIAFYFVLPFRLPATYV